MTTRDPASVFAAAMQHLASGRPQIARRMMKRAADAEHRPAISMYGSFVEHGIGGAPNPHKAVLWLKRAASLGDPASCLRLAELRLASGSEAEAKYWLYKAPSHPPALLLLAKLFSRSRSARATARARNALERAVACQELLTDNERASLDLLRAQFRNRTPDARWSRVNRKQLELVHEELMEPVSR
ncbi:tetratricopeptide repeat protein [Bosea sp. 2RAB26]|uniref:tetratricopeptide repeat protein n=1 Tax=Bosea sp. 2RAB26 TaxID=3237476 RepID=UPI003F8EACFA